MKQSHCTLHTATPSTLRLPITWGETACATIAVIDPELRPRRQMGRAIRRLGHWPLVFTSALELMQACRYLQLRFDAVVVACPVDAGAAGALIAQVREQVGPECPLVLSAGKRGLRELAVLHARESDHVEVAPSSFEEAYLLMRCFLQWHRARVAGQFVEWGAFRFDLSADSAQVAGIQVELTPNEFDLAIVLFRNVDQVLTHHALRALVWDSGHRCGSGVLSTNVCGLRRKLGLGAGRHGLELQAVPGQGYRLSTAASVPGESRVRQREQVRRAGERAWGIGASAPGSAA